MPKYSSKQTAGAVQQVAVDVTPGLIGQRVPPFIFMSAQHIFCWAGGTGSPGRTGVREARLTARTANKNRAGSFIDPNLASASGF